jgi:putative transposase
MKAEANHHSVALMSQVLAVSRSGFYAWRIRPPSIRACQDSELERNFKAIHERSRGTYGAPRIHAELRAKGRRVGRKRIARLMRKMGLRGVSRRKLTTATVQDRSAAFAPDLVKRNFKAQGPDQLWVADITYVPTWSRFLYPAVVLDAWSRRVVGWAFALHLRTALVLAALEMAVRRRQPRSVIHHSDKGSQYTAIAFGNRCRQAGVRPSTGSVGDAYDNAMG